MSPGKATLARQLYAARQHTAPEIAATLDVSRTTIYRSLATAAAGPDADGSAASSTPVSMSSRNVP